jgi:hypothetical protein
VPERERLLALRGEAIEPEHVGERSEHGERGPRAERGRRCAVVRGRLRVAALEREHGVGHVEVAQLVRFSHVARREAFTAEVAVGRVGHARAEVVERGLVEAAENRAVGDRETGQPEPQDLGQEACSALELRSALLPAGGRAVGGGARRCGRRRR